MFFKSKSFEVVPLLIFNLFKYFLIYIVMDSYVPILVNGLKSIALIYVHANIVPDLSNGSH